MIRELAEELLEEHAPTFELLAKRQAAKDKEAYWSKRR